MKVLFADDEARMRELVFDFLTAKGYEVILAEDGMEAWDIFKASQTGDDSKDIDLVILDVMMPKMDGYEVLKRIREESKVPAMLLTAKSGEYDELLGFSLGVDEYIKKPFSPKILMARVEALLRRNSKEPDEVYRVGDIEINTTSHRVLYREDEIELTAKEFELLLMFVINKNIVLSRQQILDKVWSNDYDVDERTVDAHIKKLRAKLGSAGNLIKTVWAVGYKFEEQ